MKWITNKDLLIAWVCQVALVVKNPPANAGDIRDMGLTQVATQKMLIPFLFLFKGSEYTSASWPS